MSSSLPPPKDPAPKQWIAGTKAPFYRHQSSLETPSLLPLPTTPHSYQGQCPTMLPHNTPLNDPHQAYCCFQKHCPDSGHCLTGQLGQRTPHLLYAHSLWSTIFTQAVIGWSKNINKNHPWAERSRVVLFISAIVYFTTIFFDVPHHLPKGARLNG